MPCHTTLDAGASLAYLAEGQVGREHIPGATRRQPRRQQHPVHLAQHISRRGLKPRVLQQRVLQL